MLRNTTSEPVFIATCILSSLYGIILCIRKTMEILSSM